MDEIPKNMNSGVALNALKALRVCSETSFIDVTREAWKKEFARQYYPDCRRRNTPGEALSRAEQKLLKMNLIEIRGGLVSLVVEKSACPSLSEFENVGHARPVRPFRTPLGVRTATIDKTQDPLALQQLGGWKNQQMPMHYAKIRAPRLEQTMRSAEKRLKLVVSKSDEEVS